MIMMMTNTALDFGARTAATASIDAKKRAFYPHCAIAFESITWNWVFIIAIFAAAFKKIALYVSPQQR